MRLFIAINLPQSERQAIHHATAPLRDAARSVTWVAPECIHLTMKFLGEQPPEAVASIRAAGFARVAVDLRGFRSGSLNILQEVSAA